MCFLLENTYFISKFCIDFKSKLNLAIKQTRKNYEISYLKNTQSMAMLCTPKIYFILFLLILACFNYKTSLFGCNKCNKIK